jgi:micrococcal nuclease
MLRTLQNLSGLIAILALGAICAPPLSPQPAAIPTPNVPATVQRAVQATIAALPKPIEPVQVLVEVSPPRPTLRPTPTTVPAPEPPYLRQPPERNVSAAGVERVIDGDTVDVEFADIDQDRVVFTTIRVRLIGIDTPEMTSPSGQPECFAREATAKLAELLSKRRSVELESDASMYTETHGRDRYGRLLAYLWVYEPAPSGKAMFINAELVREGYARAVVYPPDVRHAQYLLLLEREAREQGRGMWSACR